MRRMLLLLLSVVVVLCFSVSAFAAKPGNGVNPGGFPAGEHYTLDIPGKKGGFTCPGQKHDEFNNPIYGTSLFAPENGTGI
ncbi:MAG: hypothetical protein P8Y66_06175 [Nitrospirota bacterium]|jgi:hypothetical protein